MTVSDEWDQIVTLIRHYALRKYGDWAAGIEVVPPWCCEPAKQLDRDASRRHRLSPRPWAGARRAESVDARRPAGRSSQDLSRRDTDMEVSFQA